MGTRSRPIGFRLRAVSEMAQIQERYGVRDNDPFFIYKTVESRLENFGRPIRRKPRGRMSVREEREKEKERNQAPLDRPIHINVIREALSLLRIDLRPLFADARAPLRFCRPITPRRKFPPPMIEDDPYRPKIPQPLPMLDMWTVLDSVKIRMEFWFRVLFWLKGLLSMIEESLAKDHEDLIILDSGPEIIGEGLNARPYWRTRGVVPTAEPNLWTCNLDPRFSGPEFVPEIYGIPTNQQIATISSFKRCHHRDKMKFLEHMYFLYDLIQQELIPQVDAKLENLRNRELQWLEKNDQEPASADYSDYKHLVYEDAHTCLDDLLGRLASKNWVVICDALLDVRVLAKFHKERLRELLDAVIPKVEKLLKNSRPVVSKSVVMACGDLFVVYGDTMANNELVGALVLKATGLHNCVAEDARKLLISMAEKGLPNVLLSKVVPLLYQRSPFVRSKAYQFLRLCVGILGKEGIVAYALAMEKLDGECAERSRKSAERCQRSAERRRLRTLVKKPWHAKKQKSNVEVDEMPVF